MTGWTRGPGRTHSTLSPLGWKRRPLPPSGGGMGVLGLAGGQVGAERGSMRPAKKKI